MNRRILFGVAIAFFVIVCLSLGGLYLYVTSAIANVYITLDKMSVSSQSAGGGTNPLDLLVRGLSTEILVDSTIAVDNRNSLGATVESIDYRVRINGRDVGEGHGPEGGSKEISGNSKSEMVTRTRLPITSLLSAGADSLVRGESKIDIAGKAKVRFMFLTVERDFQLTPKKVEGERLDRLLGGKK